MDRGGAKRSNFQTKTVSIFPDPDLSPKPFQLSALILGGADAVNEFLDHGQTPASGIGAQWRWGFGLFVWAWFKKKRVGGGDTLLTLSV